MIELDNRGNLPDYTLEIIISKDKRFREEMNEAIRQAVNIYNNGRGTYSDIKRQTSSQTS